MIGTCTCLMYTENVKIYVMVCLTPCILIDVQAVQQ